MIDYSKVYWYQLPTDMIFKLFPKFVNDNETIYISLFDYDVFETLEFVSDVEFLEKLMTMNFLCTNIVYQIPEIKEIIENTDKYTKDITSEENEIVYLRDILNNKLMEYIQKCMINSQNFLLNMHIINSELLIRKYLRMNYGSDDSMKEKILKNVSEDNKELVKDFIFNKKINYCPFFISMDYYKSYIQVFNF